MSMKAFFLVLAGIAALFTTAFFLLHSPPPPCDHGQSTSPSSSLVDSPLRSRPEHNLNLATQYGYCAYNGTLPPLNDGEGYFGCSHSAAGATWVKWTITYPTSETYYDLELSWVSQQIYDGTVFIYDGQVLLDTAYEANDPPPSDVYKCYTETCYVIYDFDFSSDINRNVSSEVEDSDVSTWLSFKMYYSLYDPYEWYPSPSPSDRLAPQERRGHNPNNTGSSFLHCSESHNVEVNGIPAGRFGCTGYEPNAVITWKFDTQIEGSKQSVLYNMTNWAYNKAPYTVKAYVGHEPVTEKSVQIKPDHEGYGFLPGTQFTVVFNSGETTIDPNLPTVPFTPPSPGFFGRFSAYTEGSRIQQ